MYNTTIYPNTNIDIAEYAYKLILLKKLAFIGSLFVTKLKYWKEIYEIFILSIYTYFF